MDPPSTIAPNKLTATRTISPLFHALFGLPLPRLFLWTSLVIAGSPHRGCHRRLVEESRKMLSSPTDIMFSGDFEGACQVRGPECCCLPEHVLGPKASCYPLASQPERSAAFPDSATEFQGILSVLPTGKAILVAYKRVGRNT